MKIPTSSSLIIATLAISSSSPSLAAPAGDASEGGMTSSPSNHLIASRTGPTSAQTLRSVEHDEVADIHERDASTGDEKPGLVGALVSTIEGIPVLGVTLAPILDALLGAVPVAQSLQSVGDGSDKNSPVSAEEFDKFAKAAGIVSSVLAGASGLPVPGPAADVVGVPTSAIGGIAPAVPAPLKDVVGRDELAAQPSTSTEPSPNGTTDSLAPPSATPANGSANTPNNTPSVPNSGSLPITAADLPGPLGALPVLPAIPALPVPIPAAPVPLPAAPAPPAGAPAPPAGAPAPPAGAPAPPAPNAGPQ